MFHRALILLALPPFGAPAQNGPVHHWPLDEGSGMTAADITGGSTGLLQNGTAWQSGHFGYALELDGADDRVDTGPCDLTTGPGDQITLSLWMKAGLMTGSEQVLMAKTSGPNTSDYVWSLSQVNSTAIRFRVQSGGQVTELTTPGSSLFSGAWYHVAGIYDGSEMRLYLNGALMAFTPKAGVLPFAPQTPSSFGDRLDGNGSFLGMLDDIRIYDHALTDQEVIDLVIGDVSVGVDDVTPITVTPDGMVHWSSEDPMILRLLDASGRLLDERAVRGTQAQLLLDRPTGLYLVCLQNAQGSSIRPLLWP